ncbi:MAG: hypothetical protein MH252_02515 [Thermosynechococcaceae cyanobacterium MS004]|nr:hypothetical protein [Thermosynechococcaceae cyanobacterium MS004]
MTATPASARRAIALRSPNPPTTAKPSPASASISSAIAQQPASDRPTWAKRWRRRSRLGAAT